jgi:uncharacterized UPF0160 family protein
MSQKKEIVRIVTHDGFIHADEVFALAVLKIYFEKVGKEMEIIRTRDLEKIAKADMAVDVGNEYDHKKNCDHHQKENRETTIRTAIRRIWISLETFWICYHFEGGSRVCRAKIGDPHRRIG